MRISLVGGVSLFRMAGARAVATKRAMFAGLALAATLALSSCASVPHESASTPLDGSVAYVERYFAKHSWKDFEVCTVVATFDRSGEKEVRRIKRGDVFVSLVPPGTPQVILETMTSAPHILRNFGHCRIPISAQLQAGKMYKVNLTRAGDQVAVWISEHPSGAPVSEKLAFDIEHPVIKPPIIILY